MAGAQDGGEEGGQYPRWPNQNQVAPWGGTEKRTHFSMLALMQ